MIPRSATTIGNLGMSEVKFPHPPVHGDTVNVTTEIVGKRESRSRPDAGIVEFEHKAFTRRETLSPSAAGRHS